MQVLKLLWPNLTAMKKLWPEIVIYLVSQSLNKNKSELKFIETSAKTGYNVKQLFRRVAAALPGMYRLPLWHVAD